MVWLLVGVCVALLVVTSFGIVGLASFWVQQRTKMIGTRRALGATRGQILRYFQAENLLLTTAGIAIGMVGAVRHQPVADDAVLSCRSASAVRMYLPLGAPRAVGARAGRRAASPARRAR